MSRSPNQVAEEELSENTLATFNQLTSKQQFSLIEDARNGHPEEVDEVEDHVGYVYCENDGESLKCDFGSGMKEVDAFNFNNSDTRGSVNGAFDTDEIEATYQDGVCYFGHEEGTEGRFISCDERE